MESEKKVEKKILKEEHLDYLIELWLKYHNETAVEIKKTYVAQESPACLAPSGARKRYTKWNAYHHTAGIIPQGGGCRQAQCGTLSLPVLPLGFVLRPAAGSTRWMLARASPTRWTSIPAGLCWRGSY